MGRHTKVVADIRNAYKIFVGNFIWRDVHMLGTIQCFRGGGVMGYGDIKQKCKWKVSCTLILYMNVTDFIERILVLYPAKDP
jgi:hypothetical protein